MRKKKPAVKYITTKEWLSKKEGWIALLLILSWLFLISFDSYYPEFIAYKHVRDISFAISLIPTGKFFVWYMTKWDSTPKDKPVLERGHYKDKGLVLVLYSLVILGLSHFTIMGIANYYTSAFGEPYNSYIILDKKDVEKATKNGFRQLGQDCYSYGYKFTKTQTFRTSSTHRVCLSRNIYNAMPEIAVLNVSGTRSFLGHRIDKKYMDMSIQNKHQEIAKEIEGLW